MTGATDLGRIRAAEWVTDFGRPGAVPDVGGQGCKRHWFWPIGYRSFAVRGALEFPKTRHGILSWPGVGLLLRGHNLSAQKYKEHEGEERCSNHLMNPWD